MRRGAPYDFARSDHFTDRAEMAKIKRDRRAGLWIVAASAATLFSIVIVFAFVGAGEKGTVAALRVSARLSFLLFWAAYAGGALASLFGPRNSRAWRGGVRDFGLAFAAALSVHLRPRHMVFATSRRPRFASGHLRCAQPASTTYRRQFGSMLSPSSPSSDCETPSARIFGASCARSAWNI